MLKMTFRAMLIAMLALFISVGAANATVSTSFRGSGTMYASNSYTAYSIWFFNSSGTFYNYSAKYNQWVPKYTAVNVTGSYGSSYVKVSATFCFNHTWAYKTFYVYRTNVVATPPPLATQSVPLGSAC